MWDGNAAVAQGYTLEVWLKKLAECGTCGLAMAALDWPQCPAGCGCQFRRRSKIWKMASLSTNSLSCTTG